MESAQKTPPAPTIDILLNLIDTRPQSILKSLEKHPHLASQSDAHGYSLVHAAVSYNELGFLRELVKKYNVDINKLDEDGETALFTAETAYVARVLVEELGIDWKIRNSSGMTAEENFVEEYDGDKNNELSVYLKGVRTGTGSNIGRDGTPEPYTYVHAGEAREGDIPPPPLPDGVRVNVGTMQEDAAGEAPDPEFRRRIEELAQSDNFQTPEGQRQLRDLVSEAISGLGAEDNGRNVRRRVD